jgi:putative transposase
MDKQRHKHLQRLDRIWTRDPIYFVTVCVERRRRILANDTMASILADVWEKAHLQHGWLVGRYVIMPDHVHFFCACRDDAKSLSEFVRLWKQWTGKHMKQGLPRLASAATEETAAARRIWQREFFDHVLRSEESYAQKWEYVRQNPVRAGLAARAEDWPYQGEIHPLAQL